MIVSVTGATGVLGREVVRALQRAGHDARSVSRAPAPRKAGWFNANIATGDGVLDALDGAYAVIHAATDPRQPDQVDVNGTRIIVDAANRVGVRHVIFISIVGVGKIPLKYYRAKHEAEQIVEAGAVRHSILRATQFHPFLDGQFSALARLPLVFAVPRGFQIQSVDASEVAARLVRAIEDGPRGRLNDFGGPEVMPIDTAARRWTVARGIAKRVVTIPVPGRLAGAFRDGHNVTPNGERGRITWTDWLLSAQGDSRIDA
jgi:uncharacterized protein YbjT (DUF2867 family)